ncbi:tail fiber domain-containing protein, partial [uncultured Sphingobium sp.]|uniref:tail fiber domain-containing protein n=1 Tax=uncultured Sphingobium sp. TaxID=316087 RepID=UPI0026349523
MAITGLEMAELVRELCHDEGTGPLALSGAAAGYRRFADAVGAGAGFPYVIVGAGDAPQWEAGSGALDASGRLVRTPLASSAGGAAVDFGPGEKRVTLTPHAGWIAAVEDHGHAMAEIAGLVDAVADVEQLSAALDAAALAIDGIGEGLAGKQAASGQLDAIAALSTTAFGRSLLEQGDAGSVRARIGALGASGVQRMGGAELHINTLTGEPYSAEGWMGRVSVMGPAVSVVMDGGQGSFRVVGTGALANNRLYRANGTLAARADIVSGDVIGDYNVWGQIGGDFVELSRVRTTYVGAAPATNNLASRMNFYVGRTGSSAMQETLRLEHQAITAFGAVAPSSDNGFALGSGAARWSAIYAASGTISTSDARSKQDLADIDEALIDAWGAVDWRQYRFGAAVAAKGDAARTHLGLVAQEVRDAIDARLGTGAAVRLGLLCHDRWNARDAETDDDGEVTPARAAGDRWGLRFKAQQHRFSSNDDAILAVNDREQRFSVTARREGRRLDTSLSAGHRDIFDYQRPDLTLAFAGELGRAWRWKGAYEW